MSFGNQIKDARTKCNLSQADLAEMANVDRKTVVRIEGGADPNTRTKRQLKNALGLDREDEVPLRYVAVKECIPASAALNYELNEARYGVSVAEQFQLGALAVALLFEGSLRWRKEKLAALSDMEALSNEVLGDLSVHLNTTLSQAVVAAGQSIKARDVLGQRLAEDMEEYGYDEYEPVNPLGQYLEHLLARMPKTLLGDDWVPPSYGVPGAGDLLHEDLVESLCGDDLWARRALMDGHVRLRDVPKDILKASLSDRQQWLADRIAPAARRDYQAFDQMMADLVASMEGEKDD